MKRKLILTPFEYGGFLAIDEFFNKKEKVADKEPIDVIHLILSAISMAGVDEVQSIVNLSDTNTTLIRKLASESTVNRWAANYENINSIIQPYAKQLVSEEAAKDIKKITYTLSHLLFAMKSSSVSMFLFGIHAIKSPNELPAELLLPIESLLSSIQTQNAKLPLVKYDLSKSDLMKLLDVLQSKRFSNYKEAQAEIEQSLKLSSKTISEIERTGKDLMRNNSNLFFLKDNVIKALPISAKVIDLFFGKLPGLLSEYVSNIVTDYLKGSKSLPIYSCREVIFEQYERRIMH